MDLEAKKIVDRLGLEPLPDEGGLYKSTYRSQEKMNGRDIGSAIYYFLADDMFSHLHRLPTDELYHFYLGDPVQLLELLPDGQTKVTILGPDILNGQEVQYVVKAGNWMGSRLLDGGRYALVGTTMSPGFEYSDYEHADDIEGLIAAYPDQADLIKKLSSDEKALGDKAGRKY